MCIGMLQPLAVIRVVHLCLGLAKDNTCCTTPASIQLNILLLTTTSCREAIYNYRVHTIASVNTVPSADPIACAGPPNITHTPYCKAHY
jgi:hypothetical protein